MKKYSSIGANSITFANPLNIDNTLQFVTQRSFADRDQTVRLIRSQVKDLKPGYVSKPGCDDGCATSKVTRRFALDISNVAPADAAALTVFKEDLQSFFNDVLTAIDEHSLASGFLPGADASFDGIAPSNT